MVASSPKPSSKLGVKAKLGNTSPSLTWAPTWAWEIPFQEV